MKPERFKRTKSVVASSAIALVVAALVIGVSSFVLDPRSASSQHLGFQLTAGSVTVSNTIDATPAGAYPTTGCSGAAKLHPGVTDCLLYRVTNVLTVNIYVTSLSLSGITFSPSTTIASDPACNTGDLTTTAFSSPSPSGRMITPGATIAVGEPISLKNDGNQDNCENGTFNFTDNVNAYYEDSTTTSLGTGTPNPSYPGNPVNFTASVTPSYPTLDASESNPPTLSTEPSPGDRVTFYECPSSSSCSSPVATLGTGTIVYNSGPKTYTASLSTSSLPTGTDYVEAAYLGSGTDFSASTSNIVTQTVQFSSACVSPPTSGANVTLTGTTNGNYTVPSGKSVWLNGGTITGNVTVPASGSFAATNGAVKGNISSSGGPISLQGTTVSNNITSSGGGVAIGPGSVLSGNLTDSGVGSVCAVGTSPSPVQISGSISVENQPTSSVPNSFCALTLKTNLTYETNGAPVVIGGSSACPGDTISGNVLVESNTASVTVGGSGFGNTVKTNLTVESNTGTVTVYGNTVSGNIAVESNTVGGGTLTSNSASGSCTLSGNNPKITVPSSTSNTAKGTNNCKASG